MANNQSTPAADDTDTRAQWLSGAEVDAWVGLFAILTKLPGLLDRELQRDCGIATFDYAVMSWLSMAANRTLRMSKLAELSNASLSRLSNVAKRLEDRGWIQRQPDPADGRFTVAQLTDTGWEKVVTAAPSHVRAVRQFVLDPLTPTQIRQLAVISSKVRTLLDAEPLTHSAAKQDVLVL